MKGKTVGMKKINEIMKKGKYTKQKIIVAVILSILASTIITMSMKVFVFDRIPILSAIFIFILLHFIFNLKDMYEFIYKYRYYIAIVVLIYCVLMGYSLSSIGIYNTTIQDESNGKYFSPILGVSRAIRSDEWVVNTPVFISQAIDDENPFDYYNDNLRGTTTDMFTVLAPPVKDILTLARPFNIGFLIFGAERGLSFLWCAKWISLILVSFEFCMLITDKKKLISLCGMLLIVFSAATVWWNWTDLFFWGMLALLLINKFLQTKKMRTKILCALGIFISAISYVFIMYPAWQLPYGYIYLAIFIWICYKNRKNYKINIKDIIIILVVILMVAGIGIRYMIMAKDALSAELNTDYPGQRFEIGGGGVRNLFSYVYSYIFPYTRGIDNPCELSGMISLYPLPMILSIIYLIKNKDRKKHFAFMLPLLFLGIIFSIFTLVQTNELFAKVTLLYMVTAARLVVPLSFIQVLLIIYLLSIVKEDTKWIKNENFIKIISVVTSIIIFSIAAQTGPTSVFGALKSYIYGLILLLTIYLFFTINKEKNKKCFIYLLIGMSIITGATVNPIQKGISVLTEKPLAKAVTEIVNNDKEHNLWITDSTGFYMSNYLLCSKARVLNSTNTYPNFELFEKVLGEKALEPEVKKIYNRYAHISIEITENKNDVELLFEDSIKLYITPEKLKDLGVNHIVTVRELEELSTETVKFDQVYNEQGILIYNLE